VLFRSLVITGNGLKTPGAVSTGLEETTAIRPKLEEFEEHYQPLAMVGKDSG